MQWERGRPINYLFLRKARRCCTRIVSIAREHRDPSYSYRTRDTLGIH